MCECEERDSRGTCVRCTYEEEEDHVLIVYGCMVIVHRSTPNGFTYVGRSAFYVRWDWPFCLSGGIINQRGSARAVDRVSIAPHQAPQEHNLKTQIKVGYIYWGMCGSKFLCRSVWSSGGLILEIPAKDCSWVSRSPHIYVWCSYPNVIFLLHTQTHIF